MFTQLQRLHDQVLQALDHNARAAAIVLELAGRRPAAPRRQPEGGSGHPRDAGPVYLWDGRRWHRQILETGE